MLAGFQLGRNSILETGLWWVFSFQIRHLGSSLPKARHVGFYLKKYYSRDTLKVRFLSAGGICGSNVHWSSSSFVDNHWKLNGLFQLTEKASGVSLCVLDALVKYGFGHGSRRLRGLVVWCFTFYTTLSYTLTCWVRIVFSALLNAIVF